MWREKVHAVHYGRFSKLNIEWYCYITVDLHRLHRKTALALMSFPVIRNSYYKENDKKIGFL
jgi:hypothetical protein